MSVSRYDRDPLIFGGRSFGSAQSVVIIRDAVRRGQLSLKEKIMSESERLDVIAGQQYQDASLWWVIAAASNIGWGLQVPAGTKISIPTNISEVLELIS
tara:strand:+ start:128 stop:424 length:297 start_codon:yes stop_codon:yes gene_type:complete